MTHGRAASFPDKTPEELDVADGIIFEKANPENKKTIRETIGHVFSGRGHQDEPVIIEDYTGPCDARIPHTKQCHVCEVEVDPETGKVYVTKVVNVNDIGYCVIPAGVSGQQFGGAYMGVGTSNQEETVYDPQTAIKLNDSLLGYNIMVLNDIAAFDCRYVETQQGFGAYGLSGIGENIGAEMYNATYAAVHNAIGVWLPDMPSTPDRVLKALGKG